VGFTYQTVLEAQSGSCVSIVDCVGIGLRCAL